MSQSSVLIPHMITDLSVILMTEVQAMTETAITAAMTEIQTTATTETAIITIMTETQAAMTEHPAATMTAMTETQAMSALTKELPAMTEIKRTEAAHMTGHHRTEITGIHDRMIISRTKDLSL